MTKQLKTYIKEYVPYFTKILALRYNGIKGKAWRVLTDYCRQRDFIKYGVCVSCTKSVKDWKDCDGGHYISMGGHGALIGFSESNVHLQCSSCNLFASQHTGVIYQDTLVTRYGGAILRQLDIFKNSSVKADDWYFLQRIERIHGLYKELKEEYPDFEYPEYVV